MNKYAAAHGGHDLQIFWVPAIFFFLYGLGLLIYKKWAAILLMSLSAAPILLILYRLVTPPGDSSSVLEDIYLLAFIALPEVGAFFYWNSLFKAPADNPPNPSAVP
jgi:hypothetical protein